MSIASDSKADSLRAVVQEFIHKVSDGFPSVAGPEILDAVQSALTQSIVAHANQATHTSSAGANQAAAADHQVSVPRPFARKPVRVYMDGCFDLMHSGHYNAIRQAKTLGDVLVVGVHSCEEILRNKGPTVMSDDERMSIVRACKWADEVVFDTPYSPTVQLLDSLNCEFVVHGDDISPGADGTDCMALMRKLGKLKIFKRTEGISTTDLMGRLLSRAKLELDEEESKRRHIAGAVNNGVHVTDMLSPASPSPSLTKFLATSYRLAQFSNKRTPQPGDAVVYVGGSFDLFHVGHVQVLQYLKNLDPASLPGVTQSNTSSHPPSSSPSQQERRVFVYVGIHDDETVRKNDRLSRYPVMDLHERVLNVLACKYVDEVIIGAPYVVTREMITVLNIKGVLQLNTQCDFHDDDAADMNNNAVNNLPAAPANNNVNVNDSVIIVKPSAVSAAPDAHSHRALSPMMVSNPFHIAQDLGLVIPLNIKPSLTTDLLVRRIYENRVKYEKRNESRSKKEKDYQETRTYITEL